MTKNASPQEEFTITHDADVVAYVVQEALGLRACIRMCLSTLWLLGQFILVLHLAKQ